MSQVIYNSVPLGYIYTENLDHRPDTDPTGVDSVLTKTTLKVRSVIAPNLFPALNGESPYQTAARLAAQLSVPRRRLVYTQGTTTTIDTAVTPDAENGPWPEVFSVDPCPTEGGFIVHFGITLKRALCSSARGRGFLSLKWSDMESFDSRGNKTRRRSGTLIMSRQMTPNADDSRDLVIPLLPPGFRRRSSDYTLSEDGLRLRFEFVDEQLHKSVPGSAVRVSGTMSETVPLPSGGGGVGGLRRGELTVRLEGRPGTDARELLNQAVVIGMSRVHSSNPARAQGRNAGRVLLGGAVRESLNDNETVVELSLAWHIKGTAGRLTGQQASQLSAGGGLGLLGTFTAGAWSLSGAGLAGTAAKGLGSLVGAATGTGARIDSQTPEGRPQAGLPIVAPWLGKDFPGGNLAAGVPSTTRGTGLAATVRPLAAFLFDQCGYEAELSSNGATSEWVGTWGGSTVTARTGTVTEDDDEAVVEDELPGTWDVWEMQFSILKETGYTTIPATAPGEPESKVRWGNPSAEMVVKWKMRRSGGAPPIPDAVVPKVGGYTGDGTSDENWVLLRNAITLNNIELAADGVSFIYEGAGQAEFRALDANKAAIAYPVPPWLIPTDRPAAANIPRNGGLPTAPSPLNPFGGPMPLP